MIASIYMSLGVLELIDLFALQRKLNLARAIIRCDVALCPLSKNDQRWALPQIDPQIRKLRTPVFICGFANLISYRKYLRICGEKLKFTANPQSNRQCCLFRGKTAWKKWTLLFSGLEVNVRMLITFFVWRSTSG